LTRHQRSAFEPLARGQSPPWRVKGNGSDEVTLQVYPGTRYIDEVVGLRVKDQGRLYAHQAEGDQREPEGLERDRADRPDRQSHRAVLV
jgi:hypothetical protein